MENVFYQFWQFFGNISWHILIVWRVEPDNFSLLFDHSSVDRLWWVFKNLVLKPLLLRISSYWCFHSWNIWFEMFDLSWWFINVIYTSICFGSSFDFLEGRYDPFLRFSVTSKNFNLTKFATMSILKPLSLKTRIYFFLILSIFLIFTFLRTINTSPLY